ncbi:plastidial pyruvate kinase 4, chloroplastic [Dorcoceras hygrometricum]|uniref:pyruvate kinase n=1 Tax=Dorcoceras hygrometricum TaxID=472368 RepID=A0A2Z7BLK2_9LAMI|nr:plastidial pyruvate kinase 4, chloroplastic [Dorcoceras hygrometricum]
MTAGVMATFSITEQASLISQTGISDFVYPKSYGKLAVPPCKSSNKLTACRYNTLLFQRRGGRLVLRTVAHGMTHDNAENYRSHQSTDDPLFICPEEDDGNSKKPGNDDSVFICAKNDGNSKRPRKDSQVNPILEMQPTAVKPVNQASLLDKLKAIQLHILAMEQWNASRLKMCHRNYAASATNMIHFMALKGLDVEQTKKELSSIGLSDLEDIDPYVLSSLSACIQMLVCSTSDSLHIMEGSVVELPIHKSMEFQTENLSRTTMMKMASSNQDLLLGTLQATRMTHIMVTVGQEVVENDTLVADLINSGTSIFRINCAHGNPQIWSKIISMVKRSSQLLEKPCRVLMDLAGPKLRTGTLKAGPGVVKISPKRNVVGDVLRPSQVWLSPQGAGPPPPHLSPDVIIHVDGQEFLSKLEIDDSISFSDARGKRRSLRIVSKCPIFSGVGFMTECGKTAYVESGTALYAKKKRRKSSIGFVVDVPPSEQFVRLRVGDLLTISRDSSDEGGGLTCSDIGSHRIACPSGYLFDSVKPGDRIAFDDGKIWGIIKGASISEVVVSITHAGLKGSKLGSEKSINIPDSDICYEGLTSKDLMDLDFVAAHADMVGISFVRDVNDIILLRQELVKRQILNLGIVLKIETKSGFKKLPLLILEAVKSPNPLGVMIARGDLAVECGWEKLAHIQEEIISICNAAHLPVILATQVLESLVKSGVPTRAEIIDADKGRRYGYYDFWFHYSFYQHIDRQALLLFSKLKILEWQVWLAAMGDGLFVMNFNLIGNVTENKKS